MADDADEKVVRYHRRLDRTPEKQFEKLPESEKKLMSLMRDALENCRSKVDGMKDEMTEKEKAIEYERSRRVEAEERLKHFLVDPYKSPEINSELRDRLPRSNKSDPFLDKAEAESTDDQQVEEPIITKSTSDRSHSKSAVSPSRTKESKKKVRRTLNFQTPVASHTRRVSHKAENSEEEAEDSESDDCEHQHRRQHRSGSSKRRHSSHAAPVFSPLHYAPYVGGGGGYLPGLYSSPLNRPMALSPWSSVSSLGLFSSPYSPRDERTTVPAPPPPPGMRPSWSFPLLNGEKVGDGVPAASGIGATGEQSAASTNVNPASGLNPDPARSSNDPGDDGQNQEAGTASQSSSNQKTRVPSGLFSQSASSLSSHYPLPTSLGGREASGGEGVRPAFHHSGLPLYPLSPLLTSGGMGNLYGDVTARSTAFLTDEIAQLKKANSELTEKLSGCKQEMETLKMQILAEAPGDGTLSSEDARKFIELMEEVRTAEKKREDAMTTRVRQAEQDREQMMRDLETTMLQASVNPRRRLSMGDLMSASESDESDDSDSDVEEEEVKHTRVDNSTNVPRVDPDAGRVTSLKDALKELEHRQQRELQCYREELQVVMEERDQALEQMQVEREKLLVQQLRLPGQREQILMAKIAALQREKDRAENSATHLRENMDELRLTFSLHRALFGADATVNDNTATDVTHSKLSTKHHVSDQDKPEKPEKEDNQLLEQLRQANQEKLQLQTRCEELEALCKQEKDEKNKLERLNTVLRKKLVAVTTSASQQMEEE